MPFPPFPETQELLIWWVQPTVATLLVNTTTFHKFQGPAYIDAQLNSLAGRPARGRLWISDDLGPGGDLDLSQAFDKKAGSGIDRLASGCGGIVIRAEDAQYCITAGVGFITNQRLEIVTFLSEKPGARQAP
jgi:hypothetical protein